MEPSVHQLLERIERIEKRNDKVSLDKKWETSRTRKYTIILLTYLVLGWYMWFIGVQEWYINAIIPTVGFILSTLSIGWIKVFWESRQKTR